MSLPRTRKGARVTLTQYRYGPSLDRAELERIAAQAATAAGTPYDATDGQPANLHSINLQICRQARHCLALIDEGGTGAEVMSAGFQLGMLCESLNKTIAIWEVLQQQAAYTKKHVAAADALHNKPGGSRELREKIRAVWASGKYSSREICAEEEWRDLGFGSVTTARKALRNTPDPA